MIKTNNTSRLLNQFVRVAILAVGLATSFARDKQEPEVPADIAAPEGCRVEARLNAIGVQIYVCRQNPTNAALFSWVLKAPQATLLDDKGRVLGTHDAGPTWELNNGSAVVGARVNGVTVDPQSIPWLLLRVVDHAGHGQFNHTTFIQRINTVGGLAPSSGADASTVGREIMVPYAAEYVFYRN
jgi:hypothetical protein